MSTSASAVQAAQVHLFFFLFAVAAGTLLGGPDRRPHRPQAGDLAVHPGRAPFTLALPHVGAGLHRRC